LVILRGQALLEAVEVLLPGVRPLRRVHCHGHGRQDEGIVIVDHRNRRRQPARDDRGVDFEDTVGLPPNQAGAWARILALDAAALRAAMFAAWAAARQLLPGSAPAPRRKWP
jgi:hypothetical protein